MDAKKSKILFIHHAVGWGGAPKNMINVILSLDKEKYESHVLLLKDSIVSQKLREAGISYSIAESRFYKYIYKYFTHSEAKYLKWYQIYSILTKMIYWILSNRIFAKKELQDFDFDIVQLNSSVLTDWLAPCKKKSKVVIHIQEPFRKGKFDIISAFLIRQMKIYADIIIAISKDNAERIGLNDKTTLIYNYADLPSYKIDAESYRSKRFLYLGGAAYIKGFYTLVKSLKYLDDDIEIWFGGYYNITKGRGIKEIVKKLIGVNRRYRDAIALVKEHPKVKIIGLIHDINKTLSEVCCLISPSAVPHFSRPVIEAHLNKKAAIVSDVEGMDEIIDNKNNGLMFEANNEKKLAECINYIARNPEDVKIMGENGFKTAIEIFTEKNVEKYEELYRYLIS